MDGRKNNGGARPGAGRPPKAEEQELLERLSPLDDLFYDELKKGMEASHSWALKMFAEYRYGKPKETKDINVNAEQPFFPDV